MFVHKEGPSLEPVSDVRVNAYDWADDMNCEGLKEAAERSMQYYSGQPSEQTFQYGDISYSPEEMIASLKLFLDTIEGPKGDGCLFSLREKFLFFESRNAEGKSFFTGYYEPVIEGSLEPTGRFTEPVYETPGDLVAVDLGLFSKEWENETIVGRLVENKLIPYDSREEIVYQKSLKGRSRAIAYTDEVALFFLQIQGSGLVGLPDDTMIRINYAQKNGHPYNAIGQVLKERIQPEEISLQSIKKYLNENPDQVHSTLNHNQSYIFFREVREGPLGDIEVPLTAGRSIAMDRRVSARGGLAYIETEAPIFKDGKIINWKPMRRFVLVQDTGGAIRDHGRADIFFGHGKEAELLAGHLKKEGRIFLIVAHKEYLKQAIGENQ